MENLLTRIRNGVIGGHASIATPFGQMPLVYADYTASGRCLDFIEDYVREQVMPLYANTHTEASHTGAMTTRHRERARQTIRKAVNAGEQDRLIFCGSGATSAINRLIELLGWREVREGNDRPVVFIGPYEHHSNELPWREAEVDVIRIAMNDRGLLCLADLEQQLLRFADRPRKLGSFSAASNVTGIRTDVAAVASLLKSHGAFTCWDYAAAAPYVGIDMNGDTPLDAVFISPHKFVGGPGTPGILLVKEALCALDKPALSGGGTVSWVSANTHHYVSDIERREEGGTPAIIEAIRAGLVFELQQMVGTDRIEHIERARVKRALDVLESEPGIDVLGDLEADRLGIVSMRFHCGDSWLHHGFVVSLLNDLFGIQVRGGCSCAGPYGHELLSIDEHRSDEFASAIGAGFGALRPGWVRLNFNWFISDEEFEFLLSALQLVARFGAHLLSQYEVDPGSGVWRHRNYDVETTQILNLADTLSGTEITMPSAPPALSTVLEQAGEVFADAVLSRGSRDADLNSDGCFGEFDHLRWFVHSPTSATHA